MATTINADTSTGGAVVTGDGSGVLALQAAGVTQVTINTSGVTLANPLPAASGGTGSISGLNLATSVTGTLPIANGGTGTTSTTFANLTTNVTGTLPIANGGTNSTATPTAGGVVYGTGTAQAVTAVGTSGQFLKSNGASAPSWVATQLNVWVYVTMSAGVPTLQNSNGVTSISDDGVGTFTVNMSVTRTSQYYATSASVWSTAFTASTRPESTTPTTKFWVYTYNAAGTLTDPTFSWSAMSAGAN
jgi:hypothetical protein